MVIRDLSSRLLTLLLPPISRRIQKLLTLHIPKQLPRLLLFHSLLLFRLSGIFFRLSKMLIIFAARSRRGFTPSGRYQLRRFQVFFKLSGRCHIRLPDLGVTY